MLKTGRAHLEALRDGRTVYVGGERVADVTTHPSFRRAAQSVAGLYDLKLAPAQRDTLSYEEGVTISGMKLLATGAVFADELWVGNVQPVAPDRVAEAITCALPMSTPGLALWSRKSFEPQAECEFDNPLSYRFDESDSVAVFD